MNYELHPKEENECSGHRSKITKERQKSSITRSGSLPNFKTSIAISKGLTRIKSFSSGHLLSRQPSHNLETFDHSKTPLFSLHQSNILYFFFFMAAFIIIVCDMSLQIMRSDYLTILEWFLMLKYGWLTKAFAFLLFLNLLLWLDLNKGF